MGLVAAGALLSGCPTTSGALDITPITSIYIRSESLVAGLGCGTTGEQVFRYVAIAENTQDIRDAADAGERAVLAYGAVVDCFADGVFAELAPAANGALNYEISVYAFSKAAYDAHVPTIDAARGLVPPRVTLTQVEGLKAALDPISTYRTSCTATQQVGVPVLARCFPLEPLDAGGGADGGDAGEDAGDAGDGGDADDAGPDGGDTDASPTDGGDAGESDADAGP
jgi:hypothetical protein